jgi:hypothetical protein
MKNDRGVNQHLVIKYAFKFNRFVFNNFVILKIISQASRQSLPLFKQSNVDPGWFFLFLKKNL